MRSITKLKRMARLTAVAAGALILTLTGLPLSLFALVASYDFLQMKLAGRAFGGKDVVIIPLLVASLWLLKMAWELWRELFRQGPQ